MDTTRDEKAEKDEGRALRREETTSTQDEISERPKKKPFVRLGRPLTSTPAKQEPQPTEVTVKEEVPAAQPPAQTLNASVQEPVAVPSSEAPASEKSKKHAKPVLLGKKIKVEDEKDKFPQKVEEPAPVEDKTTNKTEEKDKPVVEENKTSNKKEENDKPAVVENKTLVKTEEKDKQVKLRQDQTTFYDIGQNQVKLEGKHLTQKNEKMKKEDSSDSIVYRLFGGLQEQGTSAQSPHAVSPEHSDQTAENSVTSESSHFDTFSHFGDMFNKLVNSLTWLSSLHLTCAREAKYLTTQKNNNTYGVNQTPTTTNVNYQKNSPSYSVNYVNTQNVIPTNKPLSPKLQSYTVNTNQQPSYTSPNYAFNEYVTSYDDNFINVDSDFNMDNNYNYMNPVFAGNSSFNQSDYEPPNYNQGYSSQNYNQGYSSSGYENPNYSSQGYKNQSYGDRYEERPRSGQSYGGNTSSSQRYSNEGYKSQSYNSSYRSQGYQEQKYSGNYSNQGYREQISGAQGPPNYEQNYNQMMSPNYNKNTGSQNTATKFYDPHQQTGSQKNYRGKYFFNNRVVNGVEQEVYSLDVDLGLTYSRTYY